MSLAKWILITAFGATLWVLLSWGAYRTIIFTLREGVRWFSVNNRALRVISVVLSPVYWLAFLTIFCFISAYFWAKSWWKNRAERNKKRQQRRAAAKKQEEERREIRRRNREERAANKLRRPAKRQEARRKSTANRATFWKKVS